MDEQQKIRAALARLADVLADIAATASVKNTERCPYKTVASLCTFHGGCMNQLRAPDEPVCCSGDHLIVWQAATHVTPATEPS